MNLRSNKSVLGDSLKDFGFFKLTRPVFSLLFVVGKQKTKQKKQAVTSEMLFTY